MTQLLLLLLLAYAALNAFAWLLADRMMFLPPPASYRAAQLPIVFAATDDGARIALLHLPNEQARFTILYSHGNAEDLGHLLPVLQQLHDAGYAVIGYDYRGYGLSTGGPPTAHGAGRDLEAAYRHAVQQLGITPDRIVLHGRSVGSGPATELAAREPVAGLIIESGFTSAFVVVTRMRILPFDRFPNRHRIRDVRAPVLIIHGTADGVIPFDHGRRLYAAAQPPKQALWVEGAGHNDVAWVGGRRYQQALTAFAALVREHPSPRPD